MDLIWLTNFVAIVDSKGFSQASRRNNIAPSVLSKQLTKLEKHVGLKLIQRSTYHFQLTEAGNNYYQYAKKILLLHQEAIASTRLKNMLIEGQLTITLPTALFRSQLASYINDFSSKYVKVNLSLREGNTNHFVLEGSADIAITTFEPHSSYLMCKKLLTLNRALFASPRYIKKYGLPNKPQDLKEHNCLVNTIAAPDQVWLVAGESVAVQGNFNSSNTESLISLALKDKGIINTFADLIQHELAAGKLIRIFPKKYDVLAPIYLSYHPQVVTRPSICFIKYLEACIKMKSSK